MNNLEHLKNLVVTDNRTVKESVKRTKEVRNPTGLTLRIYSNGDVYPSQELVDKFNLNFENKDNPFQGFGLDIIDTAQWEPMMNQPRMILVGLISKSQPKVDLFGSTKYNPDNTPKGNVMNGTYNEELLNLVTELNYLQPNARYVDLVVAVDYPVTTTDGISYINKQVMKGKDKGNLTYVKRENSTMYPLVFNNLQTVNPTVEENETLFLTIN